MILSIGHRSTLLALHRRALKLVREGGLHRLRDTLPAAAS
jgi:hypothetical protein